MNIIENPKVNASYENLYAELLELDPCFNNFSPKSLKVLFNEDGTPKNPKLVETIRILVAKKDPFYLRMINLGISSFQLTAILNYIKNNQIDIEELTLEGLVRISKLTFNERLHRHVLPLFTYADSLTAQTES